MQLIVESERWCEAGVAHAVTTEQRLQCGDVATVLCTQCGTALCDEHENVCGRCGRSFCRGCDHICSTASTQAA